MNLEEQMLDERIRFLTEYFDEYGKKKLIDHVARNIQFLSDACKLHRKEIDRLKLAQTVLTSGT